MKKRGFRYLLITISLLAPLPAYSDEVQNEILKSVEPYSITIVGEYHKRPDSTQFFQSLISRYLQQNKCLVVALEIASNQQAILDDIVQGKANVSDIEIPQMIDHSPFRALIDDLVRIKRSGNCLKLIAIDAELGISISRDEWLARKLVNQISQIPILALLGNLHTLKKVEWNMPISKASPYVAEILASLEHPIRTYPQIWLDRTCNTSNRVIPSNEEETTMLINYYLISLLNASEYETVNDVVDGVVLWECN